MLNGEYSFHLRSAIVEATHRWRPLGTVRRIAIHRFDHLGDMLLSTPAIRALRRRFPNAEIVMVAGEWNEIILRHNPNIDRLIFYNSPRFARPPLISHSLADLRGALGAWRPDMIVALRDDAPTMMSAMRSTARYIGRGRSHLVDWLRRRGNNTVPRPHEIDRTLQMLRDHGIEHGNDRQLDYTVTESERSDAAALIAARGIPERFVAIQPGTSLALKEWSLERFAAVARHLSNTHGLRIVLVGAESERERTRALGELISDLDPIDITGTMGLRTTVALLERASLYWHATGFGRKEPQEAHAFEHFGISVVEAMGVGCVPLCYGAAGPLEIIEFGKSGWHFDTFEELSTLTELMAWQPARLEEMRRATQQRAHAFSEAAFAQRFNAFLDEVAP